jgi:hypothetical protein
MSLENSDVLELLDRYNFLIEEYVKMAGELAGKLEKFGKYKQELQALSVEFVRRGVKPQEPDSLKKLIEAELEKRGTKPNVG